MLLYRCYKINEIFLFSCSYTENIQYAIQQFMRLWGVIKFSILKKQRHFTMCRVLFRVAADF
ncbi:hypothetical protein SAMN05444280_10758 [Tangfeifania diversioriginum]|uniref:Uncharacterized protein n=1 Tax=Tangfeifania diversioriginum TaxID=1168035 RepID=A0A1M6ENB0_9BACT|nr:hypothetical protein SAMN05444280_10758 [Tangfeifania diversioriginum]